MSDRIELTGLRVHARHGVLAAETELGQQFSVDIIAWVDMRAATKSDDLADTLNYAELAQLAYEIAAGEPLNLLEAVAGRIAEKALAQFSEITEIEVKVHKPSAPIPLVFDDIAVIAHRRR
ncbi:dihydroneopterin aldolase [Corynebacterium caspium]|uniref:dihydroneopterin aldolase n=1 Tax=Corynebacterium caspium TaxID=234828 RepID=UPI00037A0C15|nr:dihydroneopterin aldolase [Corynebacterium caspium]WKD58694.1 putative dihydroneopterin aldolase [Corynebacterium caspium DSM 44850]